MKEIWKSIKNFEGLYEVSNLGNVKALKRTWRVWNYRGKKYQEMSNKEKILSYSISKCNYKQVVLTKQNKKYLKTIHRLVAESFIPNLDNKPCVNHKDGNKLNNNVENLEWCTYSENSKHSWNNNLEKPYWKGKFGKNHNTAKQVNQYDLEGNFIKTWECISDVVRILKIDGGRITKCCQHKKYCHSAGGYIWEYTK